ncbi:JmjC domain-containing protein [Nocardioides sp. SYSU D00065]|uniref:cupin domain-containing protein n=1 Tax=Nocardioides sp. SYSU D00065 TaxID=2817378 RepID=UPI0027DE893F|nr:cupin domain-containing protein [Nocardioides sp. SYSU D00065]
MHVHRTDPAFGADVLSLEAADHLLTETAIRAPAVRVARNGSVLPESTFTRGGSLAGKPLTGLVDPVKLMRLHDEGATIVLQGLQRYHSPVGDLIAELELELGHPCQANAYLTPPGAQGFAVHSDSHDVFVVQTHGTKLWEIHGDGGPGELLLEPGVVAYLPTGTPHAARAQEAVSLHLTIGINQLTWRSLLTREVGRLVAEVPDEHLPAGYLDDPARLAEGLGGHLAALADAVRRLDPATLAAEQAASFLSGRPPRLAGALLDRAALAGGLDADTRLRRRRGHPCELVDDGDTVRVLIGDRVLRVPSRVREALEHVAAHAELTPSDLSSLDAESALVLCRRLVREGLLEVVR